MYFFVSAARAMCFYGILVFFYDVNLVIATF